MNLYDTLLAKALSGSGGGGGGGEVESGVWVGNDQTRGTITFQNEHSTAPAIIIVTYTDQTNPQASKSTLVQWAYIDWYKIAGSSFMTLPEDARKYSEIVYTYLNSTSTSSSTNYGTIYNSDAPENTDTNYPRYFATETEFHPSNIGSTSRYFRAKEYSWIAIWV